jgi:hypothetical protein
MKRIETIHRSLLTHKLLMASPSDPDLDRLCKLGIAYRTYPRELELPSGKITFRLIP